MNIYSERIGMLRAQMAENGWDAVIITGSDPHASEYVASRWRQVEWLSGFTGEAGDMVVTPDHAGLWTDSRFFIQAVRQLEGTGIELHKTRVPGAESIPSWLEGRASVVAVDGLCQTTDAVMELERAGLKVADVPDLLSSIWPERPQVPGTPVITLSEETVGRSRYDKLTDLRKFLIMNDCDCIFITALDQISLAAYTGNLIITGEPGSDTLELAKNVVKDLKAKNPDFSGRIAKITGSALSGSKKPPEELVEKLAGGVLMIEKAGEISEECAKKLQQALNQERWGILVILMDTKRRIRKLLEENPEMASFFNARFDVEALDNSTLVAYGCQYARMQEYAIDELGRLALHTRIEDMQTSDHIVTVKDVREIVDDAIDHAERKTPKHFMDVLLSRRYDDNDMIILHEGDFI